MHAPDAVDLDSDLARFCALGLAAPPDDAAFNALALRVFSWQYEALASYHGYCQRRGVLPQRMRHWTEIPAVPAQAFKDVRLWAGGGGTRRGIPHIGHDGQRPAR